MKFHRRRRADNGINLTPLIDVVFLLLIFFMVTTTFTKETRLLIELPEASGEVADSSPATLELVIAKDGNYAVNGQNLINRDIKTIMAALDYRHLRTELDRSRLLFVAHRTEILQQSQTTFRHVLRDGAFGELWG